jgi:hypothetical protein
MKTKMLSALALAFLTTGIGVGTAQADGDEPKLEAKSGKELFCRVKVKFSNKLDQAIQIDRLRVSSSTDAGFFSEFELSGSRYRPVSGATVHTPELDVMVPAGHKLATEVTYRKQITAGKNPKFSQPKTEDWGAGAIQPACSLAGQELTLTIN